MSDERTPSTAEVLNLVKARMFQALRVATPARVTRYDSAKQLVDVQPLVHEKTEGEDGELVDVKLPVITNVPVVFPGAGGFRLTFPVQAGDTVLVVFTDRSIDAWQAHGNETNPADLRRHDITDAIAIPGLHANSSPWSGASTSDMTIGKDGGPQIAVTGSQIHLGGSAEPVLKGDSYASAVSTYFAAIVGVFAGLGLSNPGPLTGTILAGLFAGFGTAQTAAFTTAVAAAKSTVTKTG